MAKKTNPRRPTPGWHLYPDHRPSRTDPGDAAEYQVRNRFGDLATALHISGRGFILTNDHGENGGGFQLADREIVEWRRID